ncbi:MAG: lytic transglycosylase domain-containing protein [Candidatus Altiarchaeota archaeon]
MNILKRAPKADVEPLEDVKAPNGLRLPELLRRRLKELEDEPGEGDTLLDIVSQSKREGEINSRRDLLKKEFRGLGLSEREAFDLSITSLKISLLMERLGLRRLDFMKLTKEELDILEKNPGQGDRLLKDALKSDRKAEVSGRRERIEHNLMSLGFSPREAPTLAERNVKISLIMEKNLGELEKASGRDGEEMLDKLPKSSVNRMEERRDGIKASLSLLGFDRQTIMDLSFTTMKTELLTEYMELKHEQRRKLLGYAATGAVAGVGALLFSKYMREEESEPAKPTKMEAKETSEPKVKPYWGQTKYTEEEVWSGFEKEREFIETFCRKNQVNPVSLMKYAKDFKVDPLLVLATMRTESNFKPDAISKAGARGIMQVMDATAKEWWTKHGYNVEELDPHNQDHCMRIGAGTLSWALQDIRWIEELPDERERLRFALAVYNAGYGNVREAVNNAGGRVDYAAAHRYFPKQETKDYVPKVLGFYDRYRREAGMA